MNSQIVTYVFARKAGETTGASSSRSSYGSSLSGFTANSLESLRARGTGRTGGTTRTNGSNLSLEEGEGIRSRAFLGPTLRLLELSEEWSNIRW